MNKALQCVAGQIAGPLIQEITGDQQVARSPYQDMADRLARMVGEEVAAWIERIKADTSTEVRAVLGRLLEVEKKLEKLPAKLDSVSAKEDSSGFPNLIRQTLSLAAARVNPSKAGKIP